MGVVFGRRKTSPIFGNRNPAKILRGNVLEAFFLSDNGWLQKLTRISESHMSWRIMRLSIIIK